MHAMLGRRSHQLKMPRPYAYDEGEICATIEIKINYFKPVIEGTLSCMTELVNRGKTVANLESKVFLGKVLVAQANGNYAILRPRKTAV